MSLIIMKLKINTHFSAKKAAKVEFFPLMHQERATPSLPFLYAFIA